MDKYSLKEVMLFKNFVVVGNTIDDTKYAYKIKNELLKNNYNVKSVYKELKSINDVDFNIDVIDLCINSVKGLEILKECKKEFKVVLIQPGAEGPELINYLQENNIQYVLGCALVGLKLYSNI